MSTCSSSSTPLFSLLFFSLAFHPNTALPVIHYLSYLSNFNAVISFLQAVGGRPRRFGVQCRVLLPVEGARERGEAEKAMWCLIFEDQAPGLSTQEKGEAVAKEKEEEWEKEKEKEVESWIERSTSLCFSVETSSSIHCTAILLKVAPSTSTFVLTTTLESAHCRIRVWVTVGARGCSAWLGDRR